MNRPEILIGLAGALSIAFGFSAVAKADYAELRDSQDNQTVGICFIDDDDRGRVTANNLLPNRAYTVWQTCDGETFTRLDGNISLGTGQTFEGDVDCGPSVTFILFSHGKIIEGDLVTQVTTSPGSDPNCADQNQQCGTTATCTVGDP